MLCMAKELMKQSISYASAHFGMRCHNGQSTVIVAASPLDVPTIKATITTQEMVEIVRDGRVR